MGQTSPQRRGGSKDGSRILRNHLPRNRFENGRGGQLLYLPLLQETSPLSGIQLTWYCARCTQVAVKTEKDLGQKNSPLRSEAETLIELQGSHGVPDVFWLGKRELAGEVRSCSLPLSYSHTRTLVRVCCLKHADDSPPSARGCAPKQRISLGQGQLQQRCPP